MEKFILAFGGVSIPDVPHYIFHANGIEFWVNNANASPEEQVSFSTNDPASIIEYGCSRFPILAFDSLGDNWTTVRLIQIKTILANDKNNMTGAMHELGPTISLNDTHFLAECGINGG
jgi:hypothetical protein